MARFSFEFILMNEISEYNRRLHFGLDLTRKGKYQQCLVEAGCKEKPILAHSVSRSVLSTIQENGVVLVPTTRTTKDETGRSRAKLNLILQPISHASTGEFACQFHDRLFGPIDTSPIDIGNPKALNLLYYRAILKEIWLLAKLRPSVVYQDSLNSYMHLPGHHPMVRLRMLRLTLDSVRPSLDSEDCPLTHIVRRVKSARPIVAGSCAGASMLATEKYRQPITWTFSVLPQPTEHLAVASYVRGTVAESYFRHLREVDGRELQAAVSAELIFFGENWFLNPKVWEAYGKTRQQAILEAYDNLEELLTGQYDWLKRPAHTPWYKHMRVTNRHQLNLFAFDETIFRNS